MDKGRKKFKGKYRIESTRLKGWDYGSNGTYFVTICTKNRKHYFGKIINGKMRLTEIGKVAENCWYEIPKHFPFVVLDAFVVMPNHIHGILMISKKTETQNFASPITQLDPKIPSDLLIGSNPEPRSIGNKFGPQSKNLGSIIRGYKVGVKKYGTINNIDFAWQPKYHDHIIRNELAYMRIANYIRNNPAKWDKDTFRR